MREPAALAQGGPAHQSPHAWVGLYLSEARWRGVAEQAVVGMPCAPCVCHAAEPAAFSRLDITVSEAGKERARAVRGRGDTRAW